MLVFWYAVCHPSTEFPMLILIESVNIGNSVPFSSMFCDHPWAQEEEPGTIALRSYSVEEEIS